MLRNPLRFAPAAAAALFALAACDNAGSDLGSGVSATGSVQVQVYLDRDGSRGFNQADTLFPGARISLRQSAGGKVVKSVTTGTNGSTLIEGMSVGDYVISVEAVSLGDSILVDDVSEAEIRIVPPPTVREVTIRLGYPQLSIRAARLSPAGRRVMIRGLVLSGLQSFRDTTSHLSDTSTTIRLTRASLRSGGAGNNPGDSVTVLGTVSSRAGQPTLDNALLTVFGQRPAPIPVAIISAVAGTAQGGVLDAALVVVSNLVISESAAQGPDYRVVASDGSGALTIILDGNLTVNPQAFSIGRTMTVRGVLVPDGAGKWQLKPRVGSDVTLF